MNKKRNLFLILSLFLVLSLIFVFGAPVPISEIESSYSEEIISSETSASIFTASFDEAFPDGTRCWTKEFNQDIEMRNLVTISEFESLSLYPSEVCESPLNVEFIRVKDNKLATLVTDENLMGAGEIFYGDLAPIYKGTLDKNNQALIFTVLDKYFPISEPPELILDQNISLEENQKKFISNLKSKGNFADQELDFILYLINNTQEYINIFMKVLNNIDKYIVADFSIAKILSLK
jgi:hypothetical protein